MISRQERNPTLIIPAMFVHRCKCEFARHRDAIRQIVKRSRSARSNTNLMGVLVSFYQPFRDAVHNVIVRLNDQVAVAQAWDHLWITKHLLAAVDVAHNQYPPGVSDIRLKTFWRTFAADDEICTIVCLAQLSNVRVTGSVQLVCDYRYAAKAPGKATGVIADIRANVDDFRVMA